MTSYGWTNSDGEPIMDGAAWRFEQQLDLDSRDDHYSDRFYDYEPDPIDPEDCTHGDVDFDGFTAECQNCESLGLHVVNNWPIDGDPDSETPDFILWKI